MTDDGTMRARGYTRPSGLMVATSEIMTTSDALAADIRAKKARHGLIQRRPKERVLLLPDGRKVAVQVDDFGNAHHVWDDHQDAVVRPEPLRLTVSARQTRAAGGIAALTQRLAMRTRSGKARTDG
jgi:hypothetical protein